MKLRILLENAAPVIRRVTYSPAAIYIQYPSGDTYEYMIYDNRQCQNLIKMYGKNVGRLASMLKKLNVEFTKVDL